MARGLLGVLGLLTLFLAACGGGAPQTSSPPDWWLTANAPPTESPTSDATATQTFTPAPAVPPPLPPTSTPTLIPTDGPTPTPYTPVGAITSTNANTFSINGGAVSTPAPGCEDFGPDTSNTADSVAPGSPLTVHWTSTMRGVFYYLIELRD